MACQSFLVTFVLQLVHPLRDFHGSLMGNKNGSFHFLNRILNLPLELLFWSPFWIYKQTFDSLLKTHDAFEEDLNF